MKPREQNGTSRRDIGPEAEYHAFVLRYRKEPHGPSDTQPRIRIDLEYVNRNQRWRYSALDQALACIKEVVDSLQPAMTGPEAGQN